MTNAMILKKYDPRVEYFNSVIDYLKDNGLIEAFRQKHFPSKTMKDAEETPEEPLLFEHFVVPFLFLACGLTLATINILTETLSFAKLMQCKNHIDLTCRLCFKHGNNQPSMYIAKELELLYL